jgi:RNA polymerase sigma-70 factor (ECF subfamily)
MLLCITAIQNDSDRNTVERLYCENYRWMLYVAKEILEDQDKAEDAVSQVFLKIIDKLQKFKLEDCNKTRGLIGILLKDICYDMLRAEKRRDFISLDEEDFPEDFEDFSQDHLLSEENCRALRDALPHLSEKENNVLKLKYIYGYSDKEIGQLLAISPENVRVRIHRAKAALLRVLKEGNPDDE